MSVILSSLRTLQIRLSGVPPPEKTVLPTIHSTRLAPLQVVVIHASATNLDNGASAPRIEASPRLGGMKPP
jgi:hypothetical protein